MLCSLDTLLGPATFLCFTRHNSFCFTAGTIAFGSCLCLEFRVCRHQGRRARRHTNEGSNSIRKLCCESRSTAERWRLSCLAAPWIVLILARKW